MNISRDQFDQAYAKLPFPIREYLAGSELGEIVEQVGQKHGLHVDTIGALEREVTNMLLGFTDPAQFVGELKTIGIPQGNLGPIVQEFNDKIFIPLQEKIKRVGTEDPHSGNQADMEALADELEASSPVPETPIVLPVAVMQPTAPVVAPSMPAAPAVPQPAPASVPPPMPVQPVSARPPVPLPMPRPATPPIAAPAAPTEFIRTMNQDMHAVQEHRAPEMRPFPSGNLGGAAAAPVVPPRPIQPVAPPSVPAVPIAPAMPMAAPPAPRAAPMPVSMPRPAVSQPTPQPTSAPQSTNRDALHNVLKEYGIDPYREPVE